MKHAGPSTSRSLRLGWPLVCLSLMMLLLVGCHQADDLDTTYGLRRGINGGESINGTAVLSEMIEQAGHPVSSRRYLSPKTREATVILWFPDNFKPPSEKICNWFDDWLSEGGHTLIYVARDYNAEPAYWKEVAPQVPASQQAEAAMREKESQAHVKNERQRLPQQAENEWFSLDSQPPPRSVQKLSGPWSDGINAAQSGIELNCRVKPVLDAEVLLESEGDPLVSRIVWSEDVWQDGEWSGKHWWETEETPKDSQLILINNGSFLLNYPLVNHEHRKLAGRLINELPDGASVVFLEGAEPEILDKEPDPKTPTGLELFTIWPMNWILVHLGVLGSLFLLARWPIFGLPGRVKTDSNSDFGKHVSALGELLARTRDRAFALARLRQYRQLTGQESVEQPVTTEKQPPASSSIPAVKT